MVIDTDKKYVAIEGVDGSGKSALVESLRKVFDAVYVKEPAGYITYPEYSRASDRKLASYFTMDRLMLFEDVVRPALEEGKYVISDRSFMSTLVGQSSLSLPFHEILRWHKGTTLPGMIFVCQCPSRTILSRMEERGDSEIMAREAGLVSRVSGIESYKRKYSRIRGTLSSDPDMDIDIYGISTSKYDYATLARQVINHVKTD